MRLPTSIKARITLWYILVLAVSLCFLGLFSYLMLSQNVYGSIHSPVSPVYMEIKLDTPLIVTDAGDSSTFSTLMKYAIGSNRIKQIQNSAESIIYVGLRSEMVAIDEKVFITSDVTGEQEVSLFYRVSQQSSDTLELMAVLQPVSQAKDVMNAFLRVLLISLPLTILLAGIIGFFVIRRALKPIDVITNAARGIKTQNLQERIPVDRDDELGKLSTVLNQTLDRVQSAFEREREFTADTSHGLKTPLAIMQGEATLALRGGRSREEYEKSLVSISSEITRLSSTIDRLLKLERMENGTIPLNLKEIDIGEFMADIAEDVEVLCGEKTIHFKYEVSGLEEATTVKGDKARLRDVFLNLADNAIKYTPENGSIVLTLSKQDGFVKISMQDTGGGIPVKHLSHLFERFYRVDAPESEETPGAGLGLSICQKIVELHGGKIEVKSKPGAGSTFTVLLPIPD